MQKSSVWIALSDTDSAQESASQARSSVAASHTLDVLPCSCSDSSVVQTSATPTIVFIVATVVLTLFGLFVGVRVMRRIMALVQSPSNKDDIIFVDDVSCRDLESGRQRKLPALPECITEGWEIDNLSETTILLLCVQGKCK